MAFIGILLVDALMMGIVFWIMLLGGVGAVPGRSGGGVLRRSQPGGGGPPVRRISTGVCPFGKRNVRKEGLYAI